MLVRVGMRRCSILALVYGLAIKVLSRSETIEFTNGSLVFFKNKAIASGETLASIVATNWSSMDKTVIKVSMVRVPISLVAFGCDHLDEAFGELRQVGRDETLLILVGQLFAKTVCRLHG